MLCEAWREFAVMHVYNGEKKTELFLLGQSSKKSVNVNWENMNLLANYVLQYRKKTDYFVIIL